MTDLRMPALAVAAWLTVLVTLLAPGDWGAGLVLAVAGALLIAWWRCRTREDSRSSLLLALAVLLAASWAVASLRAEATGGGLVASYAAERAVLTGTGVITSDPRLVKGRYGEVVLVRADLQFAVVRGRTWRGDQPVLLLANEGWADVELGERVSLRGRTSPARDDAFAAVVSVSRDPERLEGPGPVWRATAAVRRAIHEAVARRPPDRAALVPALVTGDDASLPPDVVAEFRVTGMTHLLAVSGTNLTLMVGFLLWVARWCGVRGRWLPVVAAAGVAGFVLIARGEPSVVRAAAMGTVGLLAMSTDGRQRGARAWGVAVVVLVLFDPWLAVSPGFALSALATAGILVLAPGWRDALARWLPAWLAEAIAVPAAAQLVCTPIVAALSGRVSLIAVLANMLAEPAVGPTTIAGMMGGLLALVWGPLGQVVGGAAALGAAWIITVADRGARVPSADVAWPASATSIALLTLICVVAGLTAHRLLAKPWLSLVTALVATMVAVAPLPRPGWPPPGWAVAMCDVGQGDALVLRTGPRSAVVVDAGGDPESVDRCLRALSVEQIPVVLLTHFHADHVDGLSGVVRGRTVGQIQVTSLREPAYGAAAVDAVAARFGVPLRVASYGETRTAGAVTWQVVGPARMVGGEVSGGSDANNASLVVLAQVRGVRLLLTGDAEPEAQALVNRHLPDLRADVVKVPHHGSAYQDLDLLTSLGARLALVSVGADNDYGHPAPATLVALERARMSVRRTDVDGDVALVIDAEGEWSVSGSG